MPWLVLDAAHTVYIDLRNQGAIGSLPSVDVRPLDNSREQVYDRLVRYHPPGWRQGEESGPLLAKDQIPCDYDYLFVT